MTGIECHRTCSQVSKLSELWNKAVARGSRNWY